VNLLVTGGAGFIGSHFVRCWLERHPEDRLLNLDLLTYAGNLASLEDVVERCGERSMVAPAKDAAGCPGERVGRLIGARRITS
jgi:dTDP-glucose 4,6-dehydratase